MSESGATLFSDNEGYSVFESAQAQEFNGEEYLHGVLDIKILSLNYLNPVSWGLGKVIPGFICKDSKNKLNIKYVSRTALANLPSLGGLSNPLVEIISTNGNSSRQSYLARTQCRRNTLNPNYFERFSINICENIRDVKIRVCDRRHGEELFLGELCLSNNDILTQCCSRTGLKGKFPLSERDVEGIRAVDIDRYASKWIKVRDENHVQYGKYGGKGLGWIELQIRFTKVSDYLFFLKKASYQAFKAHRFSLNDSRRNFYFTTDVDSVLRFPSKMILNDSSYIVPETYFAPHFNENFKIFICSHQPGLNSLLPSFVTDSVKATRFRADSCYFEISKVLREAKQFVCLFCNTLDVNFHLIQRGSGASSEISIGDMLKRLAKEGVLVMLLLDKSSSNEEVRDFFKHTKVVCSLIERRQCSHGKKTKFMKRRLESYREFNHNFGILICDSPLSSGVKLNVTTCRQKTPKVQGISCFMGGLRFTSKAYSDPDKAIVFGRLPRHQVFVRVANKAAADCLQTFVEVFRRQGRRRVMKKLRYRLRGSFAEKQLNKVFAERLFDLQGFRTKNIVLNEELVGETKQNKKKKDVDYDSDNSQDSLVYEDMECNRIHKISSPSSIQVVRSLDSDSARLNKHLLFPNVKYCAGLKIDNSIDKAVIHMIRVAEHFIYIETGALISCAQEWVSSHPSDEFNESDTSVQNIVVTEIIKKILQKMKQRVNFHVYLVLSLKNAPHKEMSFKSATLKLLYKKLDDLKPETVDLKNYISILSLVKLEQVRNTGMYNKSIIDVGTNLIIIDDKSALITSGRLDEETLIGNHDTAFGVVLSDFSKNDKSYIKAFRLSLWADHFGGGAMLNDYNVNAVDVPSSSTCSKYIRGIANENLKFYAGWTEMSEEIRKDYKQKQIIEFPIVFDSSTKKLIKHEYFSNDLEFEFSSWLE